LLGAWQARKKKAGEIWHDKRSEKIIVIGTALKNLLGAAGTEKKKSGAKKAREGEEKELCHVRFGSR
jgi:hypothetical protein